jgi:dephospho-CoA kinase
MIHFNLVTPLIILIIGASGSGKTTLLKELEKKLPAQQVVAFYFDDVGVPSMQTMIQEYGSGEMWQKTMTELWIAKAAQIQEPKIIFLEGSFNPDFAIHALQKHGLQNYLLFCIHADQNLREDRLRYQREQPELINDDMQNWAELLKQKTIELGGIVINNDNSIDQLVQNIMQNIMQNISEIDNCIPVLSFFS